MTFVTDDNPSDLCSARRVLQELALMYEDVVKEACFELDEGIDNPTTSDMDIRVCCETSPSTRDSLML